MILNENVVYEMKMHKRNRSQWGKACNIFKHKQSNVKTLMNAIINMEILNKAIKRKEAGICSSATNVIAKEN